ncbi:hypothetical protein D3C81_2081400 [compost metagenome]
MFDFIFNLEDAMAVIHAEVERHAMLPHFFRHLCDAAHILRPHIDVHFIGYGDAQPFGLRIDIQVGRHDFLIAQHVPIGVTRPYHQVVIF